MIEPPRLILHLTELTFDDDDDCTGLTGDHVCVYVLPCFPDLVVYIYTREQNASMFLESPSLLFVLKDCPCHLRPIDNSNTVLLTVN